MQFHTEEVYGHDYVWVTLDRDSFQFSVKACWDAHIGLARHPLNSDVDTSLMYEVVLGTGRNTVSGIRDLKTNTYLTDDFTGGLLDCNEYRDFWISWRDELLMVGRGQLIRNGTFLTLDAFNQTVKAVSMTTGYGDSGDWQVRKSAGIIVHVYKYVHF